MKKLILVYFAISLIISCKQTIKSTPETVVKDTVVRETVHSIRTYKYVDSEGKRLIIENSLPRGIKYTEPNGKEYARLLFWTRISNETENPLELKIDFPEDSYEVPTLPGKYFKIGIPSDTMILENEPLPDYGMANLKSFLDTNLHKPTSLKRTIKPNQSSAFFVVILFDKDAPGPTRTGLFLKGQNLFYKVTRYSGKQGGSFVDEKEIECGSIDLKNLVVRH